MRLLLCLLAMATTAGVETKPVPVLRVIDGDTIEVAADLGGVQQPVRVRLLYVDTPESKDNDHGQAMPEGKTAQKILQDLVGGRQVRLWSEGEQFKRDGFGRVLAIVLYHAEPAPAGEPPGVTVNAMLIQAGQSVYWRKYGDAPQPYHVEFLRAERLAQDEGGNGIWRTNPKWMTDKANERTAPKGDGP